MNPTLKKVTKHVLFGVCSCLLISCTGETRKPELFTVLPEYCPTPDGMAIDQAGNLILACPNFADQSQPACLVKIDQNKQITKWFDVPPLNETGYAAPMGIAFAPNGDLYICDNQGWTGKAEAQNKGRLLRVQFENGKPSNIITVASGMEHPNGVRILNGKAYVTQSMLGNIKDSSGKLVSGVYAFNLDDQDIVVENSASDPNLITTFVTQNPEVQYGADGLVFDSKGNLFVGNFGDGSLHKITFDANGNVASNTLWAVDLDNLRTTDGICVDDADNIYVADFSENAVAKVTPQGVITRIAKSPDCDGSDGGLDQPGEPIVWNGQLVVSCFDIVTGPDKVNTKHDKPYTLSSIKLNN